VLEFVCEFCGIFKYESIDFDLFKVPPDNLKKKSTFFKIIS